jgi:hypothetical protein
LHNDANWPVELRGNHRFDQHLHTSLPSPHCHHEAKLPQQLQLLSKVDKKQIIDDRRAKRRYARDAVLALRTTNIDNSPVHHAHADVKQSHHDTNYMFSELSNGLMLAFT